jgi:predicted component of type VI protein secretion system
VPMPKQTPRELHNGDVLVLGEYHVVVSIDAAAAEGAPDRTAGVDLERELLGDSGVRAAATLPPQVDGHLDASLNTSALFKDAGRSDSFSVGNAFGQAVVVPFGAPRSGSRPPPSAPGPAENSDIIAARRMERLQRVVAERESGHGDARPGLEALCRGAGLEPRSLPQEGAAAMLQLAGRLLREAIVGLKDLELTHGDIAQRYGLAPLRPGTEDPPFRLGTPADELLVQMLASHEGLAAGARAACEELMRQLEPKDLEERFERSATRNLMGARPSNWELYGELHRTLVESPVDGGIPHVAAEKFAAAFEEAVRPLPRD